MQFYVLLRLHCKICQQYLYNIIVTLYTTIITAQQMTLLTLKVVNLLGSQFALCEERVFADLKITI